MDEVEVRADVDDDGHDGQHGGRHHLVLSLQDFDQLQS